MLQNDPYSLCDELVCSNNVTLKNRSTTILWKNQSNDCTDYFCHEDTGLGWKSLCSNTQTCEDGMCKDNTQKWQVIIELDDAQVVMEDEIITTISEETGIDRDKLKIYVEVNSEGKPVSIIVFVDDEDSAERIREKVEKCSGINGNHEQS